MVLPRLLSMMLSAAEPSGPDLELELRGGYLTGQELEGVRSPVHPALRGAIAQLAGAVRFRYFGVALTLSATALGRPRVGVIDTVPVSSQSVDVSLRAITEQLRLGITAELRTCDGFYAGDAGGDCSLAGAYTLGPILRF